MTSELYSIWDLLVNTPYTLDGLSVHTSQMSSSNLIMTVINGWNDNKLRTVPRFTLVKQVVYLVKSKTHVFKTL